MRQEAPSKKQPACFWYAILAAVCITLCPDSFAGEVTAIGQPLPVGSLPAPSTTPSPIPVVHELQSETIADLPGKRFAEILSSPSLNKGVTLTRGKLEIALYKKASPSVVFLLVKTLRGLVRTSAQT